MREATDAFPCFGSDCAVLVMGAGAQGEPEEAVAMARRRLEAWHHAFSRFEPASQLSALNADPRSVVPVSALLGRLVEAAVRAARRTGGLVDCTLVDEVERAGYREHLAGAPVPLADALALAPPRSRAAPRRPPRWEDVHVDRAGGTVTRPPGLRLDSGGIAKGLFADVLATLLADHPSVAIDCGGDVRLGGADGLERAIEVVSPFAEGLLHTFTLARGGAATSGIGRRSWLDPEGRPAHHLLDPATGRPAFTGIVQATALARTATEAEALSKATLLDGPDNVERWLVHGGVVVFDDSDHRVLPARDL